MAHFIPIGEPAHDAERQALRYLVEGLPRTYTVYGNAWLVERSGVIYELDAVVVAPHAVFVVEIKAFRGRIEGTDHDWYIPYPHPSPLKLNRLTAQVLKNQLKRQGFQAGQVWVEGLVFLSATTDVNVKGTASLQRVHTKKTILAALQDESLVQRLSGRTTQIATSLAEGDLLELLTGAQRGPRPVRRIREYEILETLDHQDTFTELLGRNTLSGTERVLRIYSVPPLATDEQRARVAERARWEAQVLGRLGRSEGILSADPPFSDEAGIVLPLERFQGITLTSWIERYGPGAKGTGPGARGKATADLQARTELWLTLAQTLDEAHHQGVVHRLLRPDVVLVEDTVAPRQIRVTGFDLAKQMLVDTAWSLTTLTDDRLVIAAPEVVTAFSTAEPASDQFSLGAILALLLTGKPLFESTRQLMAARRLLRRVKDMAQRIPLSLDEAVARMVELRPPDRFPSLTEAIAAVRAGRDPEHRSLPLVERRLPIDADNLQPGTRIGADYEVLTRLGQGGMAVVYAARHVVSGRTRALKIAKSEDAAEDALRGEYEALTRLDHPNVVRVIDLTKMVEGRLTMVMERVGGENLRQWLAAHPDPEPNTQRRLAEDLLAGLEYLGQQGVTHKDLKPDNLLVADGRLTIIDFSLAGIPEDAPYGGTALYRDPASARWTHATDRYAAALCLFEVYAGRHAFDGRVPEPGQAPLVREEDIDPSGLAKLFQKALHPVPEGRFPSARAMRDALLVALGDDSPTPAPAPDRLVDGSTPLRTSGLSRRAINALGRSGVHQAGELLALTPSQIRAIHAIGTKAAAEVVAFRASLLARDVGPTTAPPRVDPPVVRDLQDSPEPVQKLALPAALRTALAQAGLPTIGAVAALTSAELLGISGIGRTRLAQVVEALHQFRDHTPATAEAAHTLDRMWELASRPLSDGQRIADPIGLKDGIDRFAYCRCNPVSRSDRTGLFDPSGMRQFEDLTARTAPPPQASGGAPAAYQPVGPVAVPAGGALPPSIFSWEFWQQHWSPQVQGVVKGDLLHTFLPNEDGSTTVFKSLVSDPGTLVMPRRGDVVGYEAGGRPIYLGQDPIQPKQSAQADEEDDVVLASGVEALTEVDADEYDKDARYAFRGISDRDVEEFSTNPGLASAGDDTSVRMMVFHIQQREPEIYESGFISASSSFEVAHDTFGDNGVVVIDLQALEDLDVLFHPTASIVGAVSGRGVLGRGAAAMAVDQLEVLIELEVPLPAVVGYVP